MVISKYQSLTSGHLFSMKLLANSINSENSLPWHEYPLAAISQASLPKPAPGTSTFIWDLSLKILKEMLEFLKKIYNFF